MLAGLGETMLDYRGIPDERLRQRLKMIVEAFLRQPEEVGKSKTRKQRPIADKESVKWLKGLPVVPEVVRGAGQQVVVVADRESDIYEVLQATTQDEHLACVIRVSWNRALAGGEG